MTGGAVGDYPVAGGIDVSARAIRASMSSTRQAVMRGPSFSGPRVAAAAHTYHQVDLLTGSASRVSAAGCGF